MNRKNIRQVLSFVLALVMLIGMVPVTSVHAAGDATVYLVPNANWKNDNARFAVYYWNSAGVSGWTDAVDNGDGYYEATIPAGYTNIIFCRMNPNAAANNWDNKWNQTSDLTVPTDGTNCYTVAEGTWDQGGGAWSTYTPDTVLYLKPNANWLSDGARFAVYYWDDAGSAWTDMADTDADGYYEATIPAGYTNVIFCRMSGSAAANDWNNKWNQTADQTIPTDGSNCYTVADGTWDNGGGTWSVYPPENDTPVTKSYYLYGWLNGADVTSNELEFVDGKLSITLTAADNYVFVKDSSGANYMTNGWLGFETKSAVLGTSFATGDKLYVPAGEYELTLTENSDGTLTLNVAPAAQEPEIPEGYTTVTIHFQKLDTWGGNINAYTWNGYDNGGWPGSAIPANAAHPGWYDLVVAQETPTAFNFIFNDGGNQTADLHTGDVTGNTELWVVGNTVSATAPGEWSGDYDYTANIHFQKPAAWGSNINIYTWNGVDNGAWPGSAVEADAINAGWYTYSVTKEDNVGFDFIFNDGNGNQTSDLAT